MRTYYTAILQGGTWAIARYRDTGKIMRCTRSFGVPERERRIIITGLSQDQAIARAAKLNGSREMRERQTVKPRHRVGIRS